MNIRVVIDVDDTISTNIRRLSYDKCAPKLDVINKINKLHDELGYTIVLYTARGMVSCDGDLERIVAKNERVLKDWLDRNDVHYDELVFGKPIGDIYVDDKALDVVDFVDAPFYPLNGGGSNRGLQRLAGIVKKDLGTPEDTERFKDWIEDCEDACLYPRVISYLYNGVYMDFIDGVTLCDNFTRADYYSILSTIERFKEKKRDGFDIQPHIDILEKNRSESKEFNDILDLCIDGVKKMSGRYKEHASFGHGDLILSNVIKGKNGLYLIDPRYFRESSSYILDYGKLRMSLMNYEKRFGLSRSDNSMYLGDFDQLMKAQGIYDLVLFTNLMYVCRLYRYKKESDRETVVTMAKEILGEIEHG